MPREPDCVRSTIVGRGMTTHLKHSYGREPVGGLRAENREYVVSIVPLDPVKSRAQHTFELVRIFGGCVGRTMRAGRG